MLKGVITRELQALVNLTVRGPGDHAHAITAIIDTGFDGHLTRLTWLFEELVLPFRTRTRAGLADGSRSVLSVFECSVANAEITYRVTAVESETDPLLGMALLQQHRLSMDIVPGGPVRIERLHGRGSAQQ